MKWLNGMAVVVISLGLMIGGLNTAEARLGGGKSFGSKFSHSQGVQRNAVENKQPAAQPRNTERQPPLANKGGIMGMLGGLALGGLLGALFFGGAFEGVNVLDILLLALIAFLLFKFMAAWVRRNQPTLAAGYPGAEAAAKGDVEQRVSGAGVPGSQGGEARTAATAHAGTSLGALRGAIPQGFDQAAFLDDAKACYTRLQKAWDDGDLAEIRQFTSDHVFAEIQDQYRARSGATHTEVVELEGEVLRVEDLDSRQEAAVLFNARLSEDGKPAWMQEVWHFTRSRTSHQPRWTLDGIQQVED